MLRLRLRLAVLLLGLAALFPSLVRAACPGDAGEPLPAAEKLQALDEELAARARECGAHAGYLAYRGAVLNALRRHAEAALLLEHALLLDPQRAGAQIDYAEALAALGDNASAAALLRDVVARPDVPAPLRQHLESRLSAVDALQRMNALAAMSAEPGARSAAAGAWQGSGALTLKLGRSSNLNSAPARDALTLTLPDGDALLLLAERFRPRAGAAGLVDANGQWIRPLDGGAALQLYADARLRASASASDTSYQQVQAGGAWNQPLAQGFASLGVSVSGLRYGGDDLYEARRVLASRGWRAGSTAYECRPSIGVEGESRRFPTAAELDGHYLGLSAGVACNFSTDRLVLAVRGGKNVARADRPGGNQRQGDLRMVWSRPLGGGRLGADLFWYAQRDAGGYSPLLDNGAARRLGRATLNLEYSFPIAPGWAVLGSVERLIQRSNLGLFEVAERALFVGLRWTFGQ